MAAELGIASARCAKRWRSERKGIAGARQGSGNYVRAGRSGDASMRSFGLNLLEGGGLPTAEVLSCDLAKPAICPDSALSEGAPHPPVAAAERALRGAGRDLARCAMPAGRRDDLSESLYLFYKALGFGSRGPRTGSAWASADWAPDIRPTPGRTVGLSNGQLGQDGAMPKIRAPGLTRRARYVPRLK